MQCIDMIPSKDGFLIPSINRAVCVECGICMNACHIISSKLNFQKPIRTYACWTKNSKDRSNSSSGGAFSIIARQILDKGGIVFGATMTEDLKVKHIAVERHEEIILLQGSKYIQSYLGDTFRHVKQELATGRLVLFTGTPCQVAGLLTYLNHLYENLYTCDVVCHGIPSQKAFDIYIDKIGIRHKSKNINFRFTEGWGYRLSRQATMTTTGGGHASSKKVIYPAKGYYIKAFSSGLMFSEACYTCHYARLERVSDFTLADYWGIGAKIPFNHPTQQGISCMLINNERAIDFIENCDNLAFEERPLEEVVEGNYNLNHASSRPAGRDSYFNDALTMPIKTLCNKYNINPTLRDYLRILKQDLFLIRNK